MCSQWAALGLRERALVCPTRSPREPGCWAQGCSGPERWVETRRLWAWAKAGQSPSRSARGRRDRPWEQPVVVERKRYVRISQIKAGGSRVSYCAHRLASQLRYLRFSRPVTFFRREPSSDRDPAGDRWSPLGMFYVPVSRVLLVWVLLARCPPRSGLRPTLVGREGPRWAQWEGAEAECGGQRTDRQGAGTVG